MFTRNLLSAGVSALLFTGNAVAQSLTRVVELKGVDYFLPPAPAFTVSLNGTSSSNYLVPLTVVVTNSSQVTAQSVGATLEHYNRTDDVWSTAFSSAIYVYSSVNGTAPTTNLNSQSFAPEYGVNLLYFSWVNSASRRPAPGPYFLDANTGAVYQAYRLVADVNQAFIQASYQDPQGGHVNLKAATVSAGGVSVAIPSRLYYTVTAAKPLAGVRIAVKDLYDLKGMITSGGNRALFDMGKVANATSTPIQKLIDAGAVIVGKNKLSEFAFAGQYHLDHIDYLLPFNPRGDGYNSPGDSSGGSAASVAAYSWLDASIGSDTGGSIRGPAIANGVHGNRPSQDAVSLAGALPLSTSMDTSGSLARDPLLWAAINRVLYSGNPNITEYRSVPSSIYLAAEFNVTDIQQAAAQDPAAKVIYDFLQALSTVMNASTIENIDLDYYWNQTGPHGTARNASLARVVNNVYGNLTTYEQWNAFGKGYINAYRSQYNGDFPYVTPNTIQGWFRANATISAAQHTSDLAFKQTVVDFASQDIFLADNGSCSDSIMVYFNTPSTFYKPNFDPNGQIGNPGSHDANPWVQDAFAERDYYYEQVLTLNATVAKLNGTASSNTSSSTGSGSAAGAGAGAASAPATSPGRFASVAGLPDFAVTIGSLASEDLYSNRTYSIQTLPIGVDIVTRRGCDFMLQDLVTRLYRAGAVKHVRTGVDI